MWVWDAYNVLQTCRPVGMTVGPIPWTAMHEYAAAKEIADTERFETLIRSMDAKTLDMIHERREDAK